jgi:hypothetical protein
LINYWEMCIGRLDEAQRNAFNALGWITDRAGEFYRVWLVDGDGMEGNLSPDEDLIVRSGLKGFLLLREAKAYTLIPEPSHSSGADARVCDSV